MTRAIDLGRLTDDDPVDLATVAAYYPWPTTSPWVRSNFIASIDGAIQGSDGKSGSFNTAADHLVFDALRATCDVVVVGAGTVRTEGYHSIALTTPQQALRDQATPPVLMIISLSLELPDQLSAHHGPVVAVTAGHPAGTDRLAARGIEVVSLTGSAPLVPTEIRQLCATRGWQRILLEGGAHLHHAFAAADALDEICLSTAPTGRGGDHLGLFAGPTFPTDKGFSLESVLTLDDTVMTRWMSHG